MISRQTLLVLAFVAVPALATETAIPHVSASALRICVDPDHPPLSLNRARAQPGIDADVGAAIAADLDLTPRLLWVDTTYGGSAIRRTLRTGQCDLFMGLPVDAAAETAGTLTLTAPYYSTGSVAIDASADAAPERPLRSNMAIGVRREDVDLRASVNRVVGELLADGRIEAIFARYRLPFSPPFTDR